MCVLNIGIIVGVINCLLILACSLGAINFLGLPPSIGKVVTEAMHKSVYPYYFSSRIAYVVSIVVIIIITGLFITRKIRVLRWLGGVFLNILWMIYYGLLLMN